MKQYTQVSMNTNLHFRVISILFLTFLLAMANIYAQLPQLPKVPYEPLKFSNVDINWYKTKKDTNRKPPISDGYNVSPRARRGTGLEKETQLGFGMQTFGTTFKNVRWAALAKEIR
ncbi:MAG: hypothetical protein IPN46_02950 [Saprospiraceae bacterium]|nr:hypothetical protein [Saprospiraceae bacterium]